MKHFALDAFDQADATQAPAALDNKNVSFPFVQPDSAAGITGHTIRGICELRRKRASLFPGKLLSDPTWDMLLQLYAAHLDMMRIDITRLTRRTRLPATTVLRRLGVLEKEGFVTRIPDKFDSRRVYVALSEAGIDAMERCFIASGPRAVHF